MVTKEMLDIIGDFSQWKGNVYSLAALIVEKQKEIDVAKLINAGFPEAAAILEEE